jgi:hypothetical protein
VIAPAPPEAAPAPGTGGLFDSDRFAAVLAVIAGTLLVVPFALGTSLPGREDLSYHAAMIESQFNAWQSLGRPSPFMAPLGGSERFLILPAMYGGTAYALAALLRFMLPLGTALVVVLALAWAGISWGVYRCARAAGVTTRLALCIAVAVVTCGQSVSTITARMAVAELVAFGAMAALLGATATLWTRGAERFGCVPIALLSSAVFFGGHPLTLLFGSLTAVVAAAAGWSVMRPHIRWRRRWPALVPGVIGVAATAWQWTVVVTASPRLREPDPRSYLENRSFVEPFGVESAPDPLKLLDPTRGPFGEGPLAPYRVGVPVLLAGAVVWTLWLCRADPSRRRRSIAAVVWLTMAAAVCVLPLSERVLRWLWPIGSMQYHWRLYSYAVALIAAAAIAAVARLEPGVRRRIGALFVVIAVAELCLGLAQASRSYPELPNAVTADRIEELAAQAPSPTLRNDATLLRAEALPFEEVEVATAEVLSRPTTNPEEPLVVKAPDAATFSLPSVGAPPFVEVRGATARAWVPSPEEFAKEEYEGRQYWLSVDGAGPDRRVTVAPSDSGGIGAGRTLVGPSSWLLVLSICSTTVAAVVMALRRRHRTGDTLPS